MSIVMDAERVAHDMAVRFGGTRDVYFRLSPEQGMQTIKWDDWGRLSEVVANALIYVERPWVKADMNKIATAIRERKAAIPIMHIDGEIQLPTPGIKQCPSPTPVFTGRNKHVEQIKNCISNGDKQRCVSVVHGLGGAGKTQVALATVQKTRDMWSDIIYVDATTRDTTISGLEDFAKAKKIGEEHTDTIRWLGNCREQWLMVFDNADDPALDLPSFFPSGDHGSILVTTRISQLALRAQGQNPACNIHQMDGDEALELLLKTAGREGEQLLELEHDAAIRLLQEFGYLALAIVHAGAYIRCSYCTMDEYRNMFLNQRQATLDEYQAMLVKVDDYHKSVYTTWLMSYELLSGPAQQLLWLMAFMHQDNITQDIFQRAAINSRTYEFPIHPFDAEAKVREYIKGLLQRYLRPNGTWNTGIFRTVMAKLLAYSLISYDRANTAYTLHVLVHNWAATVIPHPREDAIQHTTFLLAVLVNETENEEEFAYERTLEAHVNTVLHRQSKANANNALAFAQIYGHMGKWGQKEVMDLVGLNAQRQMLGDWHLDTLASLSKLAATYHHMRQFKQAEELQIQKDASTD
ncbi:hypothetical protein FRC07_009303 [Ceratobasidium sp. 392]|nr:hypothetical protein FRC07_009303 [Ceratobasidium sp. 392]